MSASTIAPHSVAKHTASLRAQPRAVNASRWLTLGCSVVTSDKRTLPEARRMQAATSAQPSALVPPPSADPRAALGPGLASAKGYAAASRSSNTRRAYARDLDAFRAWCAEKSLLSLPANGPTVALYLAALADEGLSVATIG